jgi:hypothetical protein
MATRKKTSKARKSTRVKTGWANKNTSVPGMRYLVQGVDRVGKSRTQRAHTLSAARQSRACHALVSGSILDTERNVVMVTIGGGRSKRTGASKPWTKKTIGR